MKVAHLLAWYFPENVGGTEVYVAELARRQRAAGLDVRIAAPDDVNREERHYEWDGTPVFRYPIASSDGAAAAWLEAERPQIVHVHSMSTGVGLTQVAAARRAGARVLFTAHLPSLGFTCLRGSLLRWGTDVCDGRPDPTVCAACTLHQRGVPRPIALTWARTARALGAVGRIAPGRLGTAMTMPAIAERQQAYQRTLLRDVDAFVGLNDRALSIVRANGAPESKLVLNRLGVGFAPARKAGPDAAPTTAPVRVGFIGRIYQAKGVEILVRALAGLPRQVPVIVEIIGPADADAGGRLSALLREVAAADSRLVVHGALDRAGVEEALRRLDVLCCPSTGFENGPTIALEAHAVGTPVIGTQVGAMPEFIVDGVNGRTVPAGSVEALRDLLAEIASDPAIVDRWRRALPVPRSMDDVAREYLELYERVCAG